jgi:hypothetical protein
MKKVWSILSFLLVATISQATILRVNNNSAVIGTYANAQLAHNAATAGDTIHLETSVTSYGGATCTKPLVWIGNGIFQDGSKASYMDAMTFNSGSAGTVVMGVYFYGDLQINTSNITVQRSSMYTITFYSSIGGNCNNFNLLQSMVRNSVNTTSSVGLVSGFNFTNSFFMGTFSLSGNFSNIVYSQNYFQGFSSGLAVAANNNIFYNYSSPIGLYASTVYNNLFTGTLTNSNYVGTNGNIFANTNPTSSTNTIFIGAVSGNYDSWSVLKAGSPAIANGLGGTNIGPSGGANPYKLGGIPPVPSFSQFQVQSAPVNTLPVIISTKSNN